MELVKNRVEISTLSKSGGYSVMVVGRLSLSVLGELSFCQKHGGVRSFRRNFKSPTDDSRGPRTHRRKEKY